MLNIYIWLLLSKRLHALIPLKPRQHKFIDCNKISSSFTIKVNFIRKAAKPNKINEVSSTPYSFIGIAVLKLSLCGHNLYWQNFIFAGMTYIGSGSTMS